MKKILKGGIAFLLFFLFIINNSFANNVIKPYYFYKTDIQLNEIHNTNGIKFKVNFPINRQIPKSNWEVYLYDFKSLDDFNSKIGKNIVENEKKIGKILDKKKSFEYDSKSTNNLRIYNLYSKLINLYEGENQIVACSSIRNRGDFRFWCTKPLTIYTIEKRTSTGKKYLSLATKQEIEDKIKKEKETKTQRLERYRNTFDLFKVKRSFNPTYLKIRNHQDLEKYALDYYNKYKKEGRTLDSTLFKFIGGNLYNFDQNYKGGISKEEMEEYMDIFLSNYRDNIKEQEQNKIKEKEQQKEEAITNYSDLKEKLIKNKISRKKAITFSYKLLDILKRYHTKEAKLEKIKGIEKYIEEKLGPDQFEDQILIDYVKDYLAIVKYAIEVSGN